MKKLLLFDFDGVIFDSFAVVSQSIIDTAKEFKLPITLREEVQDLYADNFFKKLKSLGLSEKEIDEFLKRQRQLRDENLSKIALCKEIEPFLQKAGKENTMCIVSSGRAVNIEKVLKLYGIEKLFQTVRGQESGMSKVHKIKDLLRETSADPKQTYFIGDTTGDIAEGNEAGVVSVGVTWGYHTREMLAAQKPDCLVDTVEDLDKVLL